ncbi:kinase-like domain-containing protein [Gymnopilus junonius]|uniref:Kinase-like domain-containing protein n=1 Tax=Gymnopilus junonius TaxID=109634 RepID=A0A9P5NT72_GYMJU|nr:kinase-like domain-containing protein [Gymnopilus junonius]
MLQYPVQLPPLSLSSPKLHSKLHNDPQALLTRKRLPLAVSTSPYFSPRPPSSVPDPFEHVLAPGDVVGHGFFLKGEQIRLVSPVAPHLSHSVPAQELEVIRQLGTGSYAVVYLVREVLFRPLPSDDGHMSTIGLMEFDNKPQTVYGREYAIKCLSKANLDDDALALQMSEVTIHQSLQLHPNIVTLHRTLETSAFLLLLLEYVPGEDLFYFLEQSRDRYDLDSPHPTDSSVTPPTPSLLSNLHPSHLLSRTRLRLISSMFSQMCDAVAACHAQQVFHRDIKPENFIVTDGTFTSPDGRLERKVIVKLTDFGLSTTDLESADMDCGSAPYMSYECRNNVAPTYRPRAADVWSLGIVLINMLYHFNPWTDTAEGACSSFDLYRKDPVNFFMLRFMGMTKPVAEVLANKVFCILPDPTDDSPRMSAAEFGAWVKNLPSLLGSHSVHRTVSNSSTGHRISLSTPMSHRPSSRQASGCTTAVRTPAIPVRSLSRAPSLEPPFEREELSTVIDQDNEDDGDDVADDIEIEGMNSRSTSTNKRRKRGARKGKGTAAAASPATAQDTNLQSLAVASESLAREISKASKASKSSSKSKAASKPFEPVSMYAMPVALLPSPRPAHTAPTTSTPAPSTPAPVTKKPSKWKLSFGKNSGSALANSTAIGRISPVEEASPPTSLDLSPSQAMATTASNVSSLLMGLNAPPMSASPPTTDSDTWSRGRRSRDPQDAAPRSLKTPSRSPGYALSTSPQRPSVRAVSPNSTRSGRPIGSSASSVVSSNWRSSMSTSSSAGTSTSAFTRYSNSSARSVSTTATSVSSASWRTSVKPSSTYSSSSNGYPHGNIPKNIKIMDGVPWELDQLPRGQHPNPVGDIFGSPPVRKQRTRKQPQKDLKLDTITERPAGLASSQKSPDNLRRDASTSTTDLDLPGAKDDASEGGVKKVQKGQINALAKMLSALRR